MKRLFLLLTVIFLVGVTASVTIAQDDFDWRAYEGTSLNLLLVKHPFADTMIERLPEFEELTGITVTFETVPEEQYFDELTTYFISGSSEYDAFMLGSYMIWQYAPANWLEPLDQYLDDASVTAPDYDADDILPFLIKDQRWDLVDGNETGTGNLWAMPWGFHTSNLIYRVSVFEEHGLDVPADLETLHATCLELRELEPDLTPLVVRGTRSWATIHPAPMSWFASYGGQDFEVQDDGTLVSTLAENAEVMAAADLWGEILRDCAQSNYADFTWYDVSNTFAQGGAAMFYDADIIAYFDHLTSPVGDDYGVAPPPGKPDGDPTANEWIWSIGMSTTSENKEATWYWMQWSTSKDYVIDAAINGLTVNPIRQSAWDDERWEDKVSTITGYYDTFFEIFPHTQVYYTPQSYFFETTTEWSAALQELHAGVPAQEAFEQAQNNINRIIAE